jgi:hypothetical protein
MKSAKTNDVLPPIFQAAAHIRFFSSASVASHKTASAAASALVVNH